MTTNVLKRNENLCDKFKMNFNEANELFGKETLTGMQMVQVNGGMAITITITAATVYKILMAIGALATIAGTCIAAYQCSSGPTSEFTVEKKNNKEGLDVTEKKPTGETTTHTVKEAYFENADGSSVTYKEETTTTTTMYD